MPERIGPYRLEGPLGHGGMGEVFLAWDELLERRVAIKRIRQGSPQTHDQRERFRREARSAARLSHSAIVQIHELIPDLAGDAIVMEYVEGANLGDRITAGALPVREALRLAREIAEGLAVAHGAGLIHRDLKAENVVITPQGQAKILDFGLVKPIAGDGEDQALTRKGILVGTYRSMSPEQASGGEVDERSDLFSLGVLLYEMLSGQPPFRGDNPLATLKRVITDHPPALSGLRKDIPQGVSDLVDGLLAKSRDDRPPNARAVIRMLRDLEKSLPATNSDSVSEMATADWAKVLRKGERISQPLTSTGGMSIKRRSRHAVAAGMVALLAVAVAGGVSYVVHENREQQALKDDSERIPLPVPPNLNSGVVEPEDYATVDLIQQQIESGEAVVLAPEFARLQSIIGRAPHFQKAHVLAARIALNLFESSREPGLLYQASDLADKAKSFGVVDPDLLEVEFRIALQTNQAQAPEILAEMEIRSPHDARIGVLRSQLLERQGYRKEALKQLTEATNAKPSWRNLLSLAQMEKRNGLPDKARDHAQKALDTAPGKLRPQELLAEIELDYGDLLEAVSRFRALINVSPRRNPLTNLATALTLLGKYSEAEEIYRRALKLDPYHPVVLLDLADVESELHQTDDAQKHYASALRLINEIEKSAALTVQDSMIRAQCLARLGYPQEARDVAERALRRSPGDPEVILQAAMVFSLIEDRLNALVQTRNAIAGGIQKHWFTGPAFSKLAQDPKFKDLIQ